MPHQDQHRATRPAPNHQALAEALGWLADDGDFDGIRFRSTCTWSPRALVHAALLWAWSDEETLEDRFHAARSALLPGLVRVPAATSQAFLKLLTAWTATLVAVLAVALRRRMREDLAGRFTVAGFAAFGVDGSRLQLPRTASNERRFAAAGRPRRRSGRPRADRAEAARRKKAESPQLWLTTALHLGTGLPWDWRIGPSDSSEREHLIRMLDGLPAGALVVADAGFVGYETWRAILDGDRHLLVRVGANVRLIRDLGYALERDGLVYLWPDRRAAKGEPPLVLRLVVVRGDRHPVYLVSSVLDRQRLSDDQVVRLYRLRWGVELFYRHFKQTFGHRKLKSRRGENAEIEATWGLMGLWALGLHGQHELSHDGIEASDVSVAKLLRAYRRAMRSPGTRPAAGDSLLDRLSRATLDPYRRSRPKASRDYPRKKQGRAIGAPEIRPATPTEIERAAHLKGAYSSRLTA